MNTFNSKQYWESRLRGKWGLHGVGYDALGRYYNNWLYRVQGKIFLRHIRFLVDGWDKVDVLDIGSGSGYYVNLWKLLGANSVTATDITLFATKELQKKFPDIVCYQLDIGDNLPKLLYNKQYHIISAFAILYHIVDDRRYQRAIENIFQMLCPGGFFIFSENFIHGETIRSEHQVSRSLSEIKTILEKTGFKVKARVPMFALMNNPVDSRSVIFKTIWKGMMFPISKLHFLGFILGALLYPFELILTSHLKEGISTELMICEKM